jgi:uncharacterized membrane protein YhaH (DUF805 family)
LKRWLKLVYISVFLIVAGVFLSSKGLWLAGYVAASLIFLMVIAQYAMVIRRFHDRARSGWWLAVLLTVSTAGYLIDRFEKPHPVAFLVVGLAVAIVNLWLLIELFFRRGTSGANRFGEDPSITGG